MHTRDDPLKPLRCLRCRSPLRSAAPAPDDVDRVECTRCASRWPVRFGIPDLRAPGVRDPYITHDEDLRAAERLAARAANADFATVLASYYESNTQVPAAQAARFIAGTLAASGRAESVLRTWQSWSGIAPPASRLLVDVGCGTAPLAIVAAQAGYTSIAIDVALRYLVMAAVRARDAGVPIVLASAGAEALPLADSDVAVVAGESLLENVAFPDRVVGEAARVLAPGGWLWITTANRWSIGLDPHLGLPLGSWLPAGVIRAYARLRGMVPPRRHLLSAGALRRLLKTQGFKTARIGPPEIAETQRAASPRMIRLAMDAYEVVRRVPAGEHLLRTIGPSLMAVARRPSPRSS